jgi:hypothetical protein
LYLIALGICGGVYAFTGFRLLLFLCMENLLFYKIFLGISGVSALFMAYILLALRPFRWLK